jgi:hypothetical protein
MRAAAEVHAGKAASARSDGGDGFDLSCRVGADLAIAVVAPALCGPVNHGARVTTARGHRRCAAND